MLEKHIQRQILEYLDLKGIFAWRNNSGAVFSEYKGRKRMIRYGLKGSSDILGILNDGRFLAIEVKKPDGKPTTEQLEFIDRINKNGGLAFIARSITEVIKNIP
jgi:hypothetical protein